MQNTLTASLQRRKNPPESVLDMTLNNLIIVELGCRIHWEHLLKECSGYDTKSDGVALETWSTLSLPSPPRPLWPEVVAPDRVLSTGQIELNCVLLLRFSTLLSLAPLLSRPKPAGLLRLVIHREHHQHDLPRHQSQPDRRHPLSIRRAPAGACGKGMLPVPEPYRGGDWGWRRLN